MDNKGWGLNTMLLMVCVIILALLTATFFAIRMNSLLGKENNDAENILQNTINLSYYVNKESEIISATDNYIKDFNITISSSALKFDINTFINNNYITVVKDKVTNNNCKGYSKVYLDYYGNKVINAYIKCDNYISKGYGE